MIPFSDVQHKVQNALQYETQPNPQGTRGLRVHKVNQTHHHNPQAEPVYKQITKTIPAFHRPSYTLRRGFVNARKPPNSLVTSVCLPPLGGESWRALAISQTTPKYSGNWPSARDYISFHLSEISTTPNHPRIFHKKSPDLPVVKSTVVCAKNSTNHAQHPHCVTN